MKRKVVQHGLSTYIISLPSKWVKKHEINKGDELDVQDTGATLLISPNLEKRKLEISKDVSDLIPRLVDRFLARSYQKGYDKISLKYDDPSIFDTIQTKVFELIGYEIIEHTDTSCVIQSISSRIELDFENSMRRALRLVKDMMKTCFMAYEEGDRKMMESVIPKDIEVNKLCYFCLRQINKQHYVNLEQTQQMHILYYLIEMLEDLGDTCKQMVKHLKESRHDNEMKRLLEMVGEQFDLSHSYFYEPSKDKANKAFMLYKDIRKTIKSLIPKIRDPNLILALYDIKDATSIVYHFTTMRLDLL